jgi:hypothetical protein
MYVCHSMYVCMHVRMYVCMYVCADSLHTMYPEDQYMD